MMRCSCSDNVCLVDSLQVLLKSEVKAVGCLEMSVCLSEESNILVQFFVSLYQFILLSLQSLLVHLDLLLILLALQVFFLAQDFLLFDYLLTVLYLDL